jgi:hypothetical protein
MSTSDPEALAALSALHAAAHEHKRALAAYRVAKEAQEAASLHVGRVSLTLAEAHQTLERALLAEVPAPGMAGRGP